MDATIPTRKASGLVSRSIRLQSRPRGAEHLIFGDEPGRKET